MNFQQQTPRRRKILLWTTGVAVLLIALVGVLLLTVDLGVFKSRVESLASEQLSRKLFIDGNLSIRLGETALIQAEQLRLENAEWADAEPFLAIARLELHVDLWSVFKGPLIVEVLGIHGIRLRVQKNDAGDYNWPLVVSPRYEVAADAGSDERESVDAGVRIKRIELSDIDANFRGADEEVGASMALVSPGVAHGSFDYRASRTPEFNLGLSLKSLLFRVSEQIQSDEAADDTGAQKSEDVDDPRLIPDVPISRDAFNAMRADIHLDIGEFAYADRSVSNLEIKIDVDQNTLNVQRVSFDGASGSVEANGRLNAGDSIVSAALELHGRDFAFASQSNDTESPTHGDVDLVLESSGANLRSLAANASGIFYLNARGGRLANSRLLTTYLGNFLGQLFDIVNPVTDANTDLELDCIVLPWRIEDGVMSSQPSSYLGTSQLNVAARGTIDLDSEAIDIDIHSTPGSRLSISAGELFNPYVNVSGTLAEPGLGVDEQGVLLSGGAAVATGGLSILAKAAWDRITRAADPCEEAAQQAQEALTE